MKAVVFGVAVCGAAQAADAPQHVTITTSHAVRPVSSDVQYRVQCKEHLYQLTVNYLQDDVALSVDGQLVASALNSTPLGKALKSKPLFGHWGFACAKNGIFMEFVGLDTSGVGAPQPVGIRGDISTDGKVDEDATLQPVPLDTLRHLWRAASVK